MDGTQRCGRCKRFVPVGNFSPSYRGKPGTWCRDCFNAYNRGEKLPEVAHDPRTCTFCGITYVPKRLQPDAAYCSRWCKDRARKDQMIADRELAKPTNRICMHCGDTLPQRMRTDAVFCSEQCNYRAHALQRKLRARTGEEAKPGYLRAFICDRDRWRCGICRKAVSRDRRHPDPLCASLDHVIPVSKGGSNDLWNLRLTHLKCNLERRNVGVAEQLAML